MKSILLASGLILSGSLSASELSLTKIARYETGFFDEGGAEIVSFDKGSKRIFTVNAASASVDVLSMVGNSSLELETSIDVASIVSKEYPREFGAANSIALSDTLLAVAVGAEPKTERGVVVFFDLQTLSYLKSIEVGYLPDMITFTKDQKSLLVANEGEPSDDYLTDPEGSISIIDLSMGLAAAKMTEIDFKAFNPGGSLAASWNKEEIRVFGPGALASQDFEPEYITQLDEKTAVVSLQENNAFAVVDLTEKKVTKLVGLGFKDYSLEENALDISDKDGKIYRSTWSNLYGMYQPDAIASITIDGKNYVLSANEGDSRDYEGFSEEARIKDLNVTDASLVGQRLKVTNTLGYNDQSASYDKLYSFGARSMSIWDEDLKLVYDSGNEISRKIEEINPENFHSDNDDNDSFDSRSDDKGSEPEGVVAAKINDRYYAFVGLERDSGIVAFDISNPKRPSIVSYVNTRDYSVLDTSSSLAGDLGPEGLSFVSSEDSPTGKPLLIVGYEVSGSTVIFEID